MLMLVADDLRGARIDAIQFRFLSPINIAICQPNTLKYIIKINVTLVAVWHQIKHQNSQSPCRGPWMLSHNYEGRLQSSWTHLINPSRNFVEVRWRSLFRSTSLGKRWTSYNAPLTSRKRAADRWSLRKFLPRSSLFIVGKAQKSHGARFELNSVFSLEKVDR
jgi:hypothetical protein